MVHFDSNQMPVRDKGKPNQIIWQQTPKVTNDERGVKCFFAQERSAADPSLLAEVFLTNTTSKMRPSASGASEAHAICSLVRWLLEEGKDFC